MINLGRCSESCNTPVNSSALIFDLSNSLCVPKKTEIVNVKLFTWNFKWQHRDSNPQTLSSLTDTQLFNIQSNTPHRYVLTTQRNHLKANLTKWLSVGLRTKWLWFESRCCHLSKCVLKKNKETWGKIKYLIKTKKIIIQIIIIINIWKSKLVRMMICL